MRRFTLMLCCLAVIGSLGFWRLTTQAEEARDHANRAETEQIHVHIKQLIQKAEDLEKAGKHELAEEVRHEAEQIEKHLHQKRQRKGGYIEEEAAPAEQKENYDIAAAEKLLNLLHREAEKLEVAKKHELAEKVRHKAEQIKEKLHHMREEAGRRSHDEQPYIAEGKKRLHQLLQEAEKLERAGKPELAEKVRHEAERAEKHLHELLEEIEKRAHHEHKHHPKHGREHQFAEAEERLEHLIHAAENLDRAGKHEMAEELRHEAEGIEKDLHHAREQEHGHHGQPSLEPVMHELKNLRKEVAELREEIQALRKELHVTMKKRVQVKMISPNQASGVLYHFKAGEVQKGKPPIVIRIQKAPATAPKNAPVVKPIPDAPKQPAKAKPPEPVLPTL